jgi:biotin carboxyl carrier protein
MKYTATVNDEIFTIEIGHENELIVNDEPYQIDFTQLPAGDVTSLLLNNRSLEAVVAPRDDAWEVLIMGELYSVQVQDERTRRLSQARSVAHHLDGDATVTSPMPGIIVAVPVVEGDTVQKGDKLVILESMKMENELRSPCDGIVTHINVLPGVSVEKGQVLVVITQHIEEHPSMN